MPLQTSKEDHKEDKPDYIDNQLLKANSYTINNDIFGRNQYIINGILFKENIKGGRYKEFELYKLKMDDYADSSGVSIDDDTHLELTLEQVPNGFIINSNVFITHLQWHTIYLVSENFRRCAICEVYCDARDHIACSDHIANMKRYKPLHKYDLTITRKINNNYHCGVCNTIFDQSQKTEHYSSKTHEDKLLFAINRVSDITYDFNIHNNNNNEKKDSYYFNVKHNYQNACMLNEPNETLDESEEYSDQEIEILENRNYNYNDDDWYPLNYNEDYSDDDYEEPMQNLEFSYATMAKKPKSDDLPDVLEVDLGNKKVTVKFNSWNMLIRPMPNRFYCMACKELGHIRKRAEHCKSEGHTARLNECTVVDEYENYFVRQVDSKCYHCGHCNNLQLINVMEDHIRSVHTHPTTVSSLLDSPAKKITHSTPIKTAKTENDTAILAIANPAKTDTDNKNVQMAIGNYTRIIINPASVFEGLRAANSNFDDIVICTFDSNLRISKLAFNIVCQGDNNYYCGLCEVNIDKERLMFHMNDVQHLTILQRTPFIQAFNLHLFREIRDALHCGLCNELIQIMPEFIIKHKYLEKHIVSLHRALGYFKNDNTLTEAKNGANVRNGAITQPKPVAEIALGYFKKDNTLTEAKNGANVRNGAITQPKPVAEMALGYFKNDNTLTEAKNGANVRNGAITQPKPVAEIALGYFKNDNTLTETKNGANVRNGAITQPKPVAEIPKITTTNVENKNVVNTNNVTNVNVKKEAPITNNNVALNNIPLPNIANKKIVPIANKNVTITAVNSNKNEHVTNTNKINVDTTKDVWHNNVKNGPNIAAKESNTNKINVDTTKNVQVNAKNGPNKENLQDINKIEATEEFVTVKNGVKEGISDELDDSYIEDFDLEEYVYIKLGNSYIKITYTAFNSLVDVGDGSKYCFVCSSVVCELSKHVESRGHTENMEKFKFVDKYNEDLIRQFYLMYHCSICNVVITRKHLHQHLSWPTHALQTENTKITSKKRKTEIKTGTKQITVSTQKENIYLNEKETDIKIYKNITIDKEKLEIQKMNKIVIFNDNVLKVPFDSWHSFSEIANGYRCKVCQSEFETNEFGLHVGSEWHKGNLEKIEKKYSPALMRKINDTTLNCVMCNTEVSNKKHIVAEHIQGKKHAKHYENMLKESSGANSYADCDQDVVML
ncbi:uncharacterized protein LOC134753352 isoform X2 [Cydia strobilella]